MSGLRSVLRDFLVWYDKQADGDEGGNYLNGDSTVYPGNGEEDLYRLASAARAVLRNNTVPPEGQQLPKVVRCACPVCKTNFDAIIEIDRYAPDNPHIGARFAAASERIDVRRREDGGT